MFSYSLVLLSIDKLDSPAAEFAAAAAGIYWRRRQPDLPRRTGAPAGFDRSQPKK